VNKGRGEEQKNEAFKQVVKFEAVVAARFAMPLPAGRALSYPRLDQRLILRNTPPPTPPPLA
jgi:hypothetical protein